MLYLIYLFLTIYVFGQNIVATPFTTDKFRTWVCVIQCFILATAWPWVILTKITAHSQVYYNLYTYVYKQDVNNNNLRNIAVDTLNNLYNVETPLDSLDDEDEDEGYS